MAEDETTERPSPDDPGKRLTEKDWTSDVEVESGGSMRMAISNAVVGLKKRYYGKGPTRAQTYINDNYVFAVMEGGLTRNEETLLEAGEEDLVRNFRLAFQEAMAKTMIEAIEQVTGRRVIGYHSQIVFRPERAFEIFVLDGPPAGRV
jgi:uncharacterized protein YbcI